MDVAIIQSRALSGIASPLITIEVHLSRGLPGFSIVGLPETAVRESKDRVRSALLNNQYDFPLKRITLNLAPADLPKAGGKYDLPIAIGILAASGQLPITDIHRYEFLGELALTGELRPVQGCLPMAHAVYHSGHMLILPEENAMEASLIEGLEIFPARHLNEICEHLAGRSLLAPFRQENPSPANNVPDLGDVRAQHQAKRALIIAAAGGHNLLMIGPPGTGKTMLAERMAGLLPPLNDTQALEIATIHSVSRQGFEPARWGQRPFRSPHHTASAVAMVGGGSDPRPGEISLAHEGILFLDELPEFDRRVLEVLREPLESGRICISRAAVQVEYPARFQLIAAMNPCPCGYLGDPDRQCRCTPEQVRRYRHRLSGPLLDRIDMHVEVPNQTREILQGLQSSHTMETEYARECVMQACNRQYARNGKRNTILSNPEVEKVCGLSPALKARLNDAITTLNLSARSLHRILKVCRTIADLDGSEKIRKPHLIEAIGYRRLERLDRYLE